MSEQNTCTRWVGSLSLGLTLIAAGLVGLGCYFLPGFNGWLACRLSPAMLVVLGAEVLYAVLGVVLLVLMAGFVRL